MAFRDVYSRQVELLIRTLPHVAEESCFALKGGTAINLFVRDMPRLSVDIDLTYLPEAERTDALSEIDAALKRIAARIQKGDGSIHITESAPKTQDTINKLIVRTKNHVQIKIEVTPVLRGCVYEPEIVSIAQDAEERFGYVEINMLSNADLYAGKIMAALDRQHPRDLFDTRILLSNEGLTSELRDAFIVYLISHGRLPYRLLNPKLKDITQEFEQNFMGMTEEEVPIELLLNARAKLIKDIRQNMPDKHKKFLLSFFSLRPEWDLLGIKNASKLPAVKWREMKLNEVDEQQRSEQLDQLEEVLSR
ncbi:MAG: hypothetical protein DHS20C09_07640 [marine bacterium B5-7]|nr:MAG: hypothetical protein DHS20C09_07640 [marine bacterium B5-7]